MVLDWLQHIDGYCERVGTGYWDEPVNALTNLTFIFAAIFMWHRTGGLVLARALCAVLFAIGVGSYLFHTHAQVWAAVMDVVPIAVFILLYLFAINRHAWGMGVWRALAVTLLFVPFAALTVPIFQMIPGLGSSAGYAPVPVLILSYAMILRTKDPRLAAGLFVGAMILLTSLAFRSIDLALCENWPLGTHFVWHLINGALLGWMIEVYRRSRLGKVAVAR